ncbi:MAG TPA: hypothetical protein VFO60_01785 [Candidatus Dormibacteraeota bacterium]|nr:hypothetical protein [Candidatus Dormibacteraeota bacterium]
MLLLEGWTLDVAPPAPADDDSDAVDGGSAPGAGPELDRAAREERDDRERAE